MKYLIIVLLLVNLTGCALLTKRDRSSFRNTNSQDSERDLTHEEGSSFGFLQQQLSNSTDSIIDTYQYRFWPGTSVVFDQDGKISGTFDSVQLSGTRILSKRRSFSSNTIVKEQDSMSLKARQKQKIVAEQRSVSRKVRPNVWLIGIIVLSILLICYPKIRKLISHFYGIVRI